MKKLYVGDKIVATVKNKVISGPFSVPIKVDEDLRELLNKEFGHVCYINSWSWDMGTNEGSISFIPYRGLNIEGVIEKVDRDNYE